jgi:ribosomal protein S18 acetylase RimI-like enzyme
MSGVCTRVTRRPPCPGDEVLLQELFADSRPDLTALPTEFRAGLTDMQFRAQRSQYATSYPNARYEVLVADDTPVGQLILADGVDSVRVVDVSVHPSHRGRGIASAVLHEVIECAQRAGRSVHLSVWSGNADAHRLYERLGFVRTDHSHPATVGYVEMQYHSAYGRRLT